MEDLAFTVLAIAFFAASQWFIGFSDRLMSASAGSHDPSPELRSQGGSGRSASPSAGRPEGRKVP